MAPVVPTTLLSFGFRQPDSPEGDYPVKDFSQYLSLDDLEPIGQGSYSDVYRYKALKSEDTIEKGTIYAVKHIRASQHDLDNSLDKIKRVSTLHSLECVSAEECAAS